MLYVCVKYYLCQDVSTSDNTNNPLQVVSRFRMTEQQEKDKKNYEAKERQAALKKNKERKMADLKVNVDLVEHSFQ